MTGWQEAGGTAQFCSGPSATTNGRGGWQSFELSSRKKDQVAESRQTEAPAGLHEDQLQKVADSFARSSALPALGSSTGTQESASTSFGQAFAVARETATTFPAANWGDSGGEASAFEARQVQLQRGKGSQGKGRGKSTFVPWKQWKMMVPKRKGKRAKKGKRK